MELKLNSEPKKSSLVKKFETTEERKGQTNKDIILGQAEIHIEEMLVKGNTGTK